MKTLLMAWFINQGKVVEGTYVHETFDGGVNDSDVGSIINLCSAAANRQGYLTHAPNCFIRFEVKRIDVHIN